jgi:hypothetical protein
MDDTTLTPACSIHPDLPASHIEAQKSGLAYVLGNTSLGDFTSVVAKARKDNRPVSSVLLPHGNTERVSITYDDSEYVFAYDRNRRCFTNTEVAFLSPTKHTILASTYELHHVKRLWLPSSPLT